MATARWSGRVANVDRITPKSQKRERPVTVRLPESNNRKRGTPHEWMPDKPDWKRTPTGQMKNKIKDGDFR